MGVCNCSMFCCTLLCVCSSIAIILMGKRELVALLNSSSWCLVMVEPLLLAVPQGCLRFVIVVFPDHTHYFWLEHSVYSLLTPKSHPWFESYIPELRNKQNLELVQGHVKLVRRNFTRPKEQIHEEL